MIRWFLDLLFPDPKPVKAPTFTLAIRGQTVYLTNERGDASEVATLQPSVAALGVAAWLEGKTIPASEVWSR